MQRSVAAWADRMDPSDLFVSAITILEIELGVLMIERRDPQAGRVLRSWLDDRVLPAFDGRILSVDTEVARRCAALHVPDPRSARDALIAATAMVHRFVLVTRNVSDFQRMDVELLNPWESE